MPKIRLSGEIRTFLCGSHRSSGGVGRSGHDVGMTAGSRGGPGGVGPWPGVRGPVTVAVPATSANLGPGFDALGVALELIDEVTAEGTSSGIQVEVSGEGAGEVGKGAEHLVVKTILTALRQLGAPEPP